MYRHPQVPSSDRSRASDPSRSARNLPASPSTPLWPADFANPDRVENIIDGATPVDNANRRSTLGPPHTPSTGRPTGGGARQIAYLPLSHISNLRASIVPRGEPEALRCHSAARSYFDPRNTPDECFWFANLLMSKHHQHEETRNITLHIMQSDLHAHLHSCTQGLLNLSTHLDPAERSQELAYEYRYCSNGVIAELVDFALQKVCHSCANRCDLLECWSENQQLWVASDAPAKPVLAHPPNTSSQ